MPQSDAGARKTSKAASVNIDYPPRYLQTDLYKDMLETPSLYKDIPNTLHLSLTALNRTSCEAVVEGIGSVMNLHVKKRKKGSKNSRERNDYSMAG